MLKRSVPFAAVVIAIVALVAYTQFPGQPSSRAVRVGAVADVRARGIVFIQHPRAYVLTDGLGFVAIQPRSPQLGETVWYCRSSGWFEDPAHGSMFSRLGYYRAGPAPRGLARYGVFVDHGDVYLDPKTVTPGPARGTARDVPPSGPFCGGGAAMYPAFRD